MIAEQLVRLQLDHHRRSLADWMEPGGLLVPTEPDHDERNSIRAELRAAIRVLEWVLGERQSP